MKKALQLIKLLLLFVSISGLFAQEINNGQQNRYQTKSDILYRNQTASEDPYILERCRLDLYFPANPSGYATVVWFHAGGLKGGERYLPEELKSQNIAIAAVNYRLYPKVSSPGYIEDAAAAVAWVFNNIEQYGGDPNSIFVAGHSAGGYLTKMVGLDKRWLAAYQIDANRIAGLISLSGHAITHFTVREELGIPGTQAIIDDLAPLFHVRPDAPPLVLITGDRHLELLGRYEENAYMAVMMKEAGHQQTTLFELQGFNHGEMVNPALTILLKQMDAILKQSAP